MRALALLLLSSLWISACAAGPESGAPHLRAGVVPTPAADVARALDAFHLAAADADEARYFSHFAKDGVFLGTDANERWTVSEFRAYAHPHFANGKAWSFRAKRRTIAFSPAGDAAWFEEDLETKNLGPARGSGVLVREGSAWLIAQYNLSIVIPNERFKEVKSLLENAKAP